MRRQKTWASISTVPYYKLVLCWFPTQQVACQCIKQEFPKRWIVDDSMSQFWGRDVNVITEHEDEPTLWMDVPL